MSASAAPLAHPRPVWAQRQSLDASRSLPTEAVHDFMALAFFTAGSAVVHQGERFVVRAGDVYLVPAGARHGVTTARAPEVWGVGFCPACYAPTELASLLDPFTRAAAGAAKVTRVPGPRQQHLSDLCAELERETSAPPTPHTELVAKSLLALILAEVTRSMPPAASTGAPVGLASDALRFIERHCLGPLSLRDVAASVGRSPSHVSTVVRRTTGRSVTEWIISGRLAEARRRLVHTDEMVDVIAERVGYADPTHFIRMFRRAHGCTPASWRATRRHQGGARG